MKRVAVQNLAGRALDHAVAKALGWVNYPDDSIERGRVWHCDPGIAPFGRILNAAYWYPSTDWTQGGPIVEREGITTRKHSKSGRWYAMDQRDGGDGETMLWPEFTYRNAERYGPLSYQVRKRRQRFEGPTPLIAAMRCYVASKLGAEIDMPTDLAPAAPTTDSQ